MNESNSPRSLVAQSSGHRHTASASGAAGDNAPSENVAFALPDVVSLESSPLGRYRLEAFKEKANDRMLDEGTAQRLRWVSLGRPRLVRTRRSEKMDEQSRLFHSQADGFYASVDTLSEREAALLAGAASRKYGVPVAAEQILPLTPGRFECSFSLPDGRLNEALYLTFTHCLFASIFSIHRPLLNTKRLSTYLKTTLRYTGDLFSAENDMQN